MQDKVRELFKNKLKKTSQIGYPLNLIVNSKTCLKRPLKKKTKKMFAFQDRLLHNAGPWEHSAILSTCI